MIGRKDRGERVALARPQSREPVSFFTAGGARPDLALPQIQE